MTRILGILSALSFVFSFIAFTWLRAVRYKARCILRRDGAELAPADIDAEVVGTVDSDLAKQERAAWTTWGAFTAAFIGFGLATVLLAR